MKKSIFVTVRTGSTRLKNKSILKIKNKHTIEYVIDAVKKSKFNPMIVLCTTTRSQDDVLCKIAEKNDINFYRGSEENKWSRWLGACKKFNIDFFVTADGDDLFYSHLLSDSCFAQHERSNKKERLIINGQGLYNDVYGFSISSLEEIEKIKNIEKIEPHNAMKFLKGKDFNIEKIKDYPKILEKRNARMTLDYPEDFQFFKSVIENIAEDDYNLYNIYNVLSKNPEITKINFFLEEAWKENQKSKK